MLWPLNLKQPCETKYWLSEIEKRGRREVIQKRISILFYFICNVDLNVVSLYTIVTNKLTFNNSYQKHVLSTIILQHTLPLNEDLTSSLTCQKRRNFCATSPAFSHVASCLSKPSHWIKYWTKSWLSCWTTLFSRTVAGLVDTRSCWSWNQDGNCVAIEEYYETFSIETYGKHYEFLILEEEIVYMQPSQFSLISRRG